MVKVFKALKLWPPSGKLEKKVLFNKNLSLIDFCIDGAGCIEIKKKIEKNGKKFNGNLFFVLIWKTPKQSFKINCRSCVVAFEAIKSIEPKSKPILSPAVSISF